MARTKSVKLMGGPWDGLLVATPDFAMFNMGRIGPNGAEVHMYVVTNPADGRDLIAEYCGETVVAPSPPSYDELTNYGFF